jgi:hypothetical protein
MGVKMTQDSAPVQFVRGCMPIISTAFTRLRLASSHKEKHARHHIATLGICLLRLVEVQGRNPRDLLPTDDARINKSCDGCNTRGGEPRDAPVSSLDKATGRNFYAKQLVRPVRKSASTGRGSCRDWTRCLRMPPVCFCRARSRQGLYPSDKTQQPCCRRRTRRLSLADPFSLTYLAVHESAIPCPAGAVTVSIPIAATHINGTFKNMEGGAALLGMRLHSLHNSLATALASARITSKGETPQGWSIASSSYGRRGRNPRHIPTIYRIYLLLKANPTDQARNPL